MIFSIHWKRNQRKAANHHGHLENTKIGKMLTKTVKACMRHKRTSDVKAEWDTAIATADGLLKSFKETTDKEVKQSASKKKSDSTADASKDGLLPNASACKTRLISQHKDMYKDPPAIPSAVSPHCHQGQNSRQQQIWSQMWRLPRHAGIQRINLWFQSVQVVPMVLLLLIRPEMFGQCATVVSAVEERGLEG